MAAPVYTLPTSGSSPKFATKASHESAINAALAALFALLDAADDALSDRISAIMAGFVAAGEWDASSGSFPSGEQTLGTFYIVTDAGTVDGVTFAVGDQLLPLVTNPSTTTYAGNWVRNPRSEIVDTVYDGLAALDASTEDRAAGALWQTKDGKNFIGAADAATDFSYQRDDGKKFYAQPSPGEYLDTMFGVVMDGITDCAPAYARIAANLPAGKTLRLAGAGVRILGSPITFEQEGIKVVADSGAEIKQADSTLTMDTMLTFSGDRVNLIDVSLNGNLAGNAGSYTGRGELLRVTGDRATITSLKIDGTQNVPFATGLYITGDFATLKQITSYNTGLNAVRSWSKNIDVLGLKMFGAYGTNCHGFVQDGDGSNILERAILRDIHFETTEAIAAEAVLFDNDGNQGGSVLIDGLYVDFPNMTGPDCFKFAYVDDATVRGFRGSHAAGSQNTTLRIQQGVQKLILDDCELPHALNFDDIGCALHVMGSSIIGKDASTPYTIIDLAGDTVIEDGVTLAGMTTAAIFRTSEGYASKINLGRLNYSAASGTPYLIAAPALAAGVLPIADSVQVGEPLSVSGGFRDPKTSTWTAGSGAADALTIKAGRHKVDNTRWADPATTTDADGWSYGDRVEKIAPASGDTAAQKWVTTPGTSRSTQWVGSTPYDVGDIVRNGANVYTCTVAGTSAASGGPTGTGTGIVDGFATRNFRAALVVFKGVGSISA